MLPAAHRLRQRREFATVVRHGRRVRSGALVIHWQGSSDHQPVRVGFVVSRSVGIATVRNKVRRRLQHLVFRRSTEIPPGTRLVIRALPAAAGLSFADLDHDMDLAMARLSGSDRRHDA